MDRGLLTVGSIFLICAAILGVALLGTELSRKQFPKALGFLHPTLGLTGILMLVARHFILGPLKYMDEGLLSLLLAVFFVLLLLLKGFGGQRMVRVLTFAHGFFGLLGLVLILWQLALNKNLIG